MSFFQSIIDVERIFFIHLKIIKSSLDENLNPRPHADPVGVFLFAIVLILVVYIFKYV